MKISAVKILDGIENIVEWLAYIAIVIMMLSTVTDATLRYLFRAPMPGVNELNQLLLLVLGCLTLAYAQRHNSHIRVDLVTTKLRGSSRIIAELINCVVGVIVFSIATWVTGGAAIRAIVGRDYIVGLLNFPLGPPKSLLPIGFGLLSLRLIVDIVYCVRYLLQPPENRQPSKYDI